MAAVVTDQEADTRAQAKKVILEIVKSANGIWHRKTALYQAFYFAHLYFWRENLLPLTEHPIVRLPAGPGIDEGDVLLEELQAEGKLRIIKRPHGPYTEFTFELLEADAPSDLDEGRQSAIRDAVQFVKDKSSVELFEITLDHSRSWHAAQSGGELNIHVDLMGETEYARMQKSMVESANIINAVFK